MFPINLTMGEGLTSRARQISIPTHASSPHLRVDHSNRPQEREKPFAESGGAAARRRGATVAASIGYRSPSARLARSVLFLGHRSSSSLFPVETAEAAESVSVCDASGVESELDVERR